MSGRFNQYMNAHFAGCRLLARARDECRNRDVSLFQVPGHWDVVGVTDGTDSWIAPTSAGPFFKTATGDVADIMRRLQAGEELPPPPDAPRKRARLVLEDDAPPPPRKPRQRIEEEAQPSPRRARHAFV